MPVITPADLATHIYAEVINEITRNDHNIVATTISTAEKEAKLYLSRFDLPLLFGAGETEPETKDPLLQSLVKDITVWHLVRLSNTGLDQATCRLAYDDAIKTLKNIMAGQAVPEGWPYADTSALESPPDGNTVTWASNEKRSNYY